MLPSCRAYLAKIGILAKPVKASSGSIQSQRPPTVTIEDLPNELLHDIGDYLNLDRKSDLHALCLSSRTLNGAATPLLYNWFLSDYDTSILHKLVRTLSKRRDLSKHFKDIILYTDLEAPAIKPSRTELIAYLELILSIAAYDGWFHTKLSTGLREGVYNVQGILLLLLAERIDTVTIVPAELTTAMAESLEVPLQYHFNHLVSSLITWATLSGGAQKALAKVHTMISKAPEDGQPIAFPTHFMALPNINILRATFAFSLRQSWSNLPQGCSPITRLHLDYCMLSTTQLAVTIKACVSLLELEVVWDELKLSEGLYSAFEVDVTRLQPALQQHSNTLTTLRLVFSTAKPDVRISDFHGSLSSLSAFTALETLELDECLLFGKKFQWFIMDWSPLDALDGLSYFLPENLSHFTFRTRKRVGDFLPMLICMTPILPASLKSLDTFLASPVQETAAQPRLEALLDLDDECSSLYVRRHEHGKFTLPEVEFSLRHSDGVHAAIDDLKSLDYLGRLWKEFEKKKMKTADWENDAA